MVFQTLQCRYCQSEKLIKMGKQSGHQRLKCQVCNRTFQSEYTHEAYKPGVRDKIERMAHNGNGIRDTARVLGINKNTVISHLKKKRVK